MYIDNQLIARILDGDNEAFSLLMQKYQSKLFSFLFHLTLSKEDAEDLLQISFIKVFKSIHKFDKTYDFLPWIHKIAFNEYRSFYKKRKQKDIILSLDELPDLLCSEDSLSSHLDKRESYLKVAGIINGLKKGQKEVFILRFGNGFSYGEIGKILGISESAAKMKYQRAKDSLTKLLTSGQKGGSQYELQF